MIKGGECLREVVLRTMNDVVSARSRLSMEGEKGWTF